MRRLFSLVGAALVILGLILGCASPGPGQATKGPITVGSKIDTEGALLSQMIILLLQDNGFDVIDKSGTGPTQVVRKAIQSGEIDIYPEYTGNGAFFFEETESDVWNDAQKGWERVKQLDFEANGIVWLKSAPANNTWAIAIPGDLAENEGISSLISSLIQYAETNAGINAPIRKFNM